jgi:hypothetical protein
MPAEAGIQSFRISLDTRLKRAGMTRRKESDQLRNPGSSIDAPRHHGPLRINELCRAAKSRASCIAFR